MAILKPTHTITPDVAFTSNTYITNGAHILYITSDQQTYIDNAVSFIATGLELGHCTVFMENIEIISIIKGKLLKKGVNQKQLETVIFGDHEVFYHSNEVLDADSILRKWWPAAACCTCQGDSPFSLFNYV